MIAFIWRSRAGKTNLRWYKSEQWLPGGNGIYWKGHRELSGMIKKYSISWLQSWLPGYIYIFIKTHRTVHFIPVHLIILKSFLNGEKKKRIWGENNNKKKKKRDCRERKTKPNLFGEHIFLLHYHQDKLSGMKKRSDTLEGVAGI